VKSAPHVVWYYINYMTTLLTIGRREEALAIIEEALKHHPNHPTVWARHGQVLRRLNKFEQALESYGRAVELDATYAWAWNGKGMCHTALNDHVAALECYRYAVKYDDSDVWFWHNYGDALYRTGRIREAKHALEQALKIDPTHEPSRILMKKILEELGE
jgi:tetratricopeptide (TPR) repeat protein